MNIINKLQIYSIPTNEFMNIIMALQLIFDQWIIYDMYAGVGLFSLLYSKYVNRFEDYRKR